MRTLVEVVARCDPHGRTVFPLLRARGQLAVRRTGLATVHLVATAFGPLGGDDVEVRIVVEEGARLSVRSVAAAVVLPARGESPPSRYLLRAEVAGGLHLAPEPTVVTARAVHLAGLHVELAGTGELTAAEQVLLGRVAEEPGHWTGSTRIERAGRPLLHTSVGLGPGAPAWLPPVAPRAYVSTVHVGRSAAEAALGTGSATSAAAVTGAGVATGVDAVRLPLPGGWVGTAWAGELHEAVDRLAAVTGHAEPVEMTQ